MQAIVDVPFGLQLSAVAVLYRRIHFKGPKADLNEARKNLPVAQNVSPKCL